MFATVEFHLGFFFFFFFFLFFIYRMEIKFNKLEFRVVFFVTP